MFSEGCKIIAEQPVRIQIILNSNYGLFIFVTKEFDSLFHVARIDDKAVILRLNMRNSFIQRLDIIVIDKSQHLKMLLIPVAH